MKKYVPLIVAAIAGISTVLTNIVSIDVALGTLAGTRFFAYLYLAWDLLKIELALAVILVLIHRPLAKVITQATMVTIKSVRRERPEKTFWRLVGGSAVIAGVVGFTAYQGYYLARGKYSLWAQHDRSLVRRAADSFLRGEHDHAKLLLNVCNTAYDTCRDTEADVNRRGEQAAAIRKMEEALPRGSSARAAYAVAAYALDRRWDLYQSEIRSLRRDFSRANVLWVKALEQLRDNQPDRVLATLAQLQDAWPGFADSNDLLDKLREGRPTAIADTVRRLGVEQVAEETAAPFAIVSLDRRALSPIQQLQLPGGPQGNRWDEYGFELGNSFRSQVSGIARGAGFSPVFEPAPRGEEIEQPVEETEPQESLRVIDTPPADQPTERIVTPATSGDETQATVPASFACERDPAVQQAGDRGILRVAIDAGHGGSDRGTEANGVTEAELVLDIGLRLEGLLRNRPQIDVVLTRRTDEFVPLEERTAIANREKADLFVSIHSNDSRDPRARGVETYTLNFATNVNGSSTASRENSLSSRSTTTSDLSEVVKAIALQDKVEESRELAKNVQASLVSRLKVRNLGVKQAPFMVLIGTKMPSVLTEIAFLSNRQDAALLKQDVHRQKIAEALCGGVLKSLDEGRRKKAQG